MSCLYWCFSQFTSDLAGDKGILNILLWWEHVTLWCLYCCVVLVLRLASCGLQHFDDRFQIFGILCDLFKLKVLMVMMMMRERDESRTSDVCKFLCGHNINYISQVGIIFSWLSYSLLYLPFLSLTASHYSFSSPSVLPLEPDSLTRSSSFSFCCPGIV